MNLFILYELLIIMHMLNYLTPPHCIAELHMELLSRSLKGNTDSMLGHHLLAHLVTKR